MSDVNGLVETLKRAALDAFEASKPANIYFGEVVNIAPLKISVEQKMLLGEKQLILSRNVTDFKTSISIEWLTQNSLGEHNHLVKGSDSEGDDIDIETDAENLLHSHEITGKKEITVHNGLAVGDNVILLRQQGGQKFIVLDRVHK